MKSLEELLVPVKTPDGWTLADQFKKMVEENQEVGDELRKYYSVMERITEDGTSTKLLLEKQNVLTAAAIEAGDIIIAAAKLIDMIGFRPATIIEACYNKNAARGYYAVNGKGAME